MLMNSLLKVCFTLGLLIAGTALSAATPNVLFIAVDDLKGLAVIEPGVGVVQALERLGDEVDRHRDREPHAGLGGRLLGLAQDGDQLAARLAPQGDEEVRRALVGRVEPLQRQQFGRVAMFDELVTQAQLQHRAQHAGGIQRFERGAAGVLDQRRLVE